jgi:hypothetical protein
VSERVDDDGVRGVAPGLQLLCGFLSVGGGEDASDSGVFNRCGKIVEKHGDSIREACGSENARAE